MENDHRINEINAEERVTFQNEGNSPTQQEQS